MGRNNYGLVSIMASICVMAAFTCFNHCEAQESEYTSNYQGLSRDSTRFVRSGWRPNVTRFERAEKSEPVRGKQTKEQKRLWTAYDGYLGPRAKTTNVYRSLAETTTSGPIGSNQKKTATVTSTDLPYVEKNGHLNSNIVVMFSATWCGPCQQMYPIMKKLRKEGYIVYIYTLDTDEYKDLNLGSKFQIRAYPTFVFFDRGKEVKRSVGGTNIEWFRKNLKLETEQDAEQESDPYDGI